MVLNWERIACETESAEGSWRETITCVVAVRLCAAAASVGVRACERGGIMKEGRGREGEVRERGV